MSMPNYIERRAEILAELFLSDLRPKLLAQASFQGVVWDYLAAFQTKNGRLVNIAIMVKGTEGPIPEIFTFYSKTQPAMDSNLPVLIIIVDVKKNAFGWNWATEAKIIKDPSLKGHAFLKMPVIKRSDEAVKKLLAEIEAK